MALEELILLYYLKISSFLIIIIFIFFIKFIFFDKVLLNKEILKINKNENISNIVNNSFETSYINKNLYIYIMKFYNDFYKHIHFGEFKFTENVTIYEILKIISEPSNSLKKILPVLIDEENYENLSVNDGAQAVAEWEKMIFGNLTDNEKNHSKESLLSYCKLDTLALVKIYQFLVKLSMKSENELVLC